MNILFHRYAEIITKKALKLRKGDVLSINTEERYSAFAHLVADIARSITGNGSYIQLIEKGKVTHTEEAATDYPIGKNASALLYLQTVNNCPEFEAHKVFNAPELQSFKLLSEPLGNPTPSLPFVTAPMPSEEWGKLIDEEDGNESLVYEVLSDLMALGEDDYLDISDNREDILEYEYEKLNALKLVRGRITNEEGTDISFEFLKGSKFKTTLETTSSNRKFIPSVFYSDLFHALDKTKTSGYLNITYPISLFGHKISSLSVTLENGRVISFDADRNLGEVFNTYLEQDNQAGVASMLTIAEDSNPAAFINIMNYPEWDRMRGVAITLGGIKATAVEGDLIDQTTDSLVTLTLPIGSDSTTITVEDEDGIEYTIYEDGIIIEEE